MQTRTPTLRAAASMLLAFGLLVLQSCTFSSQLLLDNQTSATFTPYPVVTTPPPPHREADPAGAVAPGATTELDPGGFNPVFYTGPVTPGEPNGLYLGFDLIDADPLVIQFKIFHYKVAPGQEGNDPAKQPTLLAEGTQEIANTDLTIRVSTSAPGGLPPPDGWFVSFHPN